MFIEYKGYTYTIPQELYEPENIYLLSQSWGIISQKIFNDGGEYNVDHSSPVLLLKNGKYIGRITHKDNIKRSIKIIKKYL